MTEPHLPLSGVRVVEFSTMITASLAAQMLADQGAEVVKVEPPAGDPMRRIGSQVPGPDGAPGVSALFANCNKGKRSVVLDLKAEADLSVARALCESADVVISNYRPAVMARLGLSFEALADANPRLVFARITGFGTCGPQAGSPAYDHVMQAQLGFAAIQGGAETPRHMQTAVCDKVTGIMAAQAVSSALVGAARTGRGTRIDLSMMDAGLYFLFPDSFMDRTIRHDAAVHLPPLSDTYCVLEATDGHFVLAALGDAQWRAVFAMLGRPELGEDPRFATMAARMADYRGLLEEVTRAPVPHSVAGALDYLARHDVPAAPCQDAAAVLEDPQLRACGTVQDVDDPHLGAIRAVRPAAIFADSPASADRPAPALGEHTQAVREALRAKTRKRL